MRKGRRTMEVGSPRGSGQYPHSQARRRTRRAFERGSFHRRRNPPQGSRISVPRPQSCPPARESGVETSQSLPNAPWWGLIDDCPEYAKFFDGINKFVKINWLYNVRVHPKFVTSHHVLLFVG